MHFRFKLDINANFTYQNGEWVFISAFFLLSPHLTPNDLKPIYLLLHNAIWLHLSCYQRYIKIKLLSDVASFPRIHYQIFWPSTFYNDMPANQFEPTKVSKSRCNGLCSNPAWGKMYGTSSLLFRYCVCKTVFWRQCMDKASQ